MQKPRVVSLCFLWRLTFDQNHRSWHISRCSIPGAEKQLKTDDELVSACFGHFGPASLKVYDVDFFSTGTCPFFSTLSGMIWIVQSIFPWLLQSVEHFETKKRPGLPSENSNLQRCIILHSLQSYGFVPVLDDPCGKVLATFHGWWLNDVARLSNPAKNSWVTIALIAHALNIFCWCIHTCMYYIYMCICFVFWNPFILIMYVYIVAKTKT